MNSLPRAIYDKLFSKLARLKDVSLTNPTNGQSLLYNNGVWVNSTPGAGGDVVGPALSVSGNIPIFADTTGKLLSDSTRNIAYILDRTNHTGTQTAATISDFNSSAITAVGKTNNATGWSLAGGTTSKTLTLTENSTIDQNLSTTSEVLFAKTTIVPTGTEGLRITRAVSGVESNKRFSILLDTSGNTSCVSTNFDVAYTNYSVTAKKNSFYSPTDGSGSTDWIAISAGGLTGDRIVMGSLNGLATIGAHTQGDVGWQELYLNAPGTTNVVIPTLLSVNDVNEYTVLNGVRINTNTRIYSDRMLQPIYTSAIADVQISNSQGHLYDSTGTLRMKYKDSAGTVRDLLLGGGIDIVNNYVKIAESYTGTQIKPHYAAGAPASGDLPAGMTVMHVEPTGEVSIYMQHPVLGYTSVSLGTLA